MNQRATGSFDVKVVPQKPDTQIARAANLSRLTIDKRFHGDLEGIGKGEMLALQTDVKGSAGYVALERFTGKLNGAQGSFVLQHSATMHKGESDAKITVVPDSGSGELAGLRGKMSITVAEDGRTTTSSTSSSTRRADGALREGSRARVSRSRARHASGGSPSPRPGSNRAPHPFLVPQGGVEGTRGRVAGAQLKPDGEGARGQRGAASSRPWSSARATPWRRCAGATASRFRCALSSA